MSELAADILAAALGSARPGREAARALGELLHAHFIRPEDRVSPAGAGAIYLTEVTAPGSSRRADAVHVGMWASRGGGRIDVCELKVSRADWLRELEKPEKAEAWWPYCNAFWLVVPSADIVKEGELPQGWGLMMPNPRANGRRFKVLVKPEEREPELTVPLLCTLLTSTETTKVHALRQQEMELNRRHSDQVQRIRRERGSLTPKDRDRLELLERLEEALGMELERHPWRAGITPEGAAEALKGLAQGEAALEKVRRNADVVVRDLERAADNAASEAAKLRKAIGEN